MDIIVIWRTLAELMGTGALAEDGFSERACPY
jgi:hypothetical protein